MRQHLIRFSAASALLSVMLPACSGLNSDTQPVSEGQRLAMYTKPGVVRILDGCSGQFSLTDDGKTYRYAASYGGTGSGYLIHPDGYIATNAHVVNFTANPDTCKRALFRDYVAQLARDNRQSPDAWLNNPRLTNALAKASNLRNFTSVHQVVLPNGTQLPFELKKFGVPLIIEGDSIKGKDIALIKIEVKNAPVLKLGNSDEAEFQEDVTAVGYPGAADISQQTSGNDTSLTLEATFTDGRVSAKKTLSDGSPILQFSATIAPGSSGGPVLNHKGEVIAMSTFGPRTAGLSFAIPSNTIAEFLKEAGTSNPESLVNQRYREGLERYWQHNYKQAIEKFEEAKRLYPQHSEVDRLIQESQQAIVEGKQRPAIPGWLLFVLTLVAAGAAFGAWYRLRSRKAAQPAAARPLAPAPEPAKAWQARQHKQLPASGCPVTDSPKTIVSDVQPVLRLNNKGQILQFRLHQEVYYLGRGRSWSSLDIPETGWEVLSRRHAILRQEGMDYRIYDGDGQAPSTNGLFINNARIDGAQGYLLTHGTELKIGQNPNNQVLLTYLNPAHSPSPVAFTETSS